MLSFPLLFEEGKPDQLAARSARMSVKKLFDLTGKVALITGGSRGLGLQMGEALGEMGARLALVARKADELAAAQRHLASLDVEAFPVPCDLQKADAIDPMVRSVLAHYGRIDILVNNAGATWGAPAEEHPLEAWQKLVNLNLTAAFLVTQAVGKLWMIPSRQGHIVNIASIAGLGGSLPERMRTIAYNTTKGGLVNFTRALAAEWGQYGITVNAIAPGFFPSKMTRGTLEKIGDQLTAEVPLRRLGSDEDLKGLVALLASDASRHITGQIIAVDGGVSAIV
jgi:NAD(P)-dependent dehydrogenase (short-subunit alcohol dehydrogenase family)